MDLDDLMKGMQELQNQMLNLRQQAENETVEAEAGNGAVKVVATVSKKIISITLSPDLLTNADKEEIEDLLTVAVNRVLDAAQVTLDANMQKATEGLLPPNMDF